jgi:hypothetical protein
MDALTRRGQVAASRGSDVGLWFPGSPCRALVTAMSTVDLGGVKAAKLEPDTLGVGLAPAGAGDCSTAE